MYLYVLDRLAGHPCRGLLCWLLLALALLHVGDFNGHWTKK